ncbi:BnaCnng06910D [Brassica napus]|uniref:BnaCnng06910D protein n=1 Tax=Brassica napus TaxID=3708 RepID=A0A078H3V8_BRANA|nr:BnaCnng06910D [Brassica napus]
MIFSARVYYGQEQLSQALKSNCQTPVSGDLTAKKPNGKDVVSSTELIKRAGQTGVSPVVAVSGDLKSKKLNGKAVLSSAEPIKQAIQTGVYPVVAVFGDPKSKKLDGKAVVSSAEPIRRTGGSRANAVSGELIPKKSNRKAVVSSSDEVLFFKDVKFGPQEGEIRFRLIHFWEARNAHTKILIGLEMILIDGQGTVIQGFIPPTRIDTYLPHMVAGSLYMLNKFYGSKSKTVYRVAEQDVTIAFSWNSVLSVLENSRVQFLEDRFRFYSYEEFEAACDFKGDLYDYVGHMKLVNEQTLSNSLVLDEVEIASSRRILVHVQTHDGPVMKLYLWDKAATDFCVKFKAQGNTPSVILVTTVNPKRFGGALSISSLSSSRVFFDLDVQPTRDYLTWLGSNSDVSNRIFSYIKQEGAKVARFECTATIDDVMLRSAWYYIACGGCKTKATKGPTTLMCKKCGKAEVAGVAEYLTNISVYNNNDHARFVLLYDAGCDQTRKLASELVESYFEANESVGDDAVVPVPQALVDTIGQTRKFVVKVSKHNLEGKTQALTVTKVLPLEAPVLEGVLEENVDEEPADERDEAAGGTVKRNSDGIESGETKRAKCG